VLAALGFEPSRARADEPAWSEFVLTAASADRPPTRGLHIGFRAASRELVDAFWQAGQRAGYEDDGPPGPRPQYACDYYGAFLLDPDGNSAEAVHLADAREGGCIDHLWIRVRRLEPAAAFYEAIATHAGLEDGRRWEEGRQFLGRSASFSLVHDARPPTECLELSFPAETRGAVDSFYTSALAAAGTDGTAPADAGSGRYAAAVHDPAGTLVRSACVRLGG
jgi:catechol 2,3-dioxygenase-like lactoylglutathione lyase family enzyme